MTTQPPPHNTAMACQESFTAKAEEYKASLGLNGGATVRSIGPSPLRFVEPATLQGMAVPQRQWIVDQIVPLGNVTMISGDGGLGKSLLSQQLLTACAIGRPWIGQPVTKCRAMAFFCEDDADELHRRQDDINNHYGVSFADLGDMAWQSRAGSDSMLMTFGQHDNFGKPTELLGQIKGAALSFGARLVVLDSLHDLFGGNENFRGAARSFIGALRGIAMAIDGAVVLCAHPSLTGMNTGTGAAGSTAWNNAVRSRLYLTKPKQDEDADEDDNVRTLRGMKANYSAAGGKITVRWEAGVFAPQERPTGIMAKIADQRAQSIFLECLDATAEQGRYASDAPSSSKFAPKLFARLSVAKAARLGKKDMAKAMEELFAAGKIRLGEAATANRHKVKCIVREGA